MKNHFVISDSIEIPDVNIAGVACISIIPNVAVSQILRHLLDVVAEQAGLTRVPGHSTLRTSCLMTWLTYYLFKYMYITVCLNVECN